MESNPLGLSGEWYKFNGHWVRRIGPIHFDVVSGNPNKKEPPHRYRITVSRDSLRGDCQCKYHSFWAKCSHIEACRAYEHAEASGTLALPVRNKPVVVTIAGAELFDGEPAAEKHGTSLLEKIYSQ